MARKGPAKPGLFSRFTGGILKSAHKVATAGEKPAVTENVPTTTPEQRDLYGRMFPLLSPQLLESYVSQPQQAPQQFPAYQVPQPTIFDRLQQLGNVAQPAIESAGGGGGLSSILSGGLGGLQTGAMLGNIFPGLGTTIGAIGGGLIGAGLPLARSIWNTLTGRGGQQQQMGGGGVGALDPALQNYLIQQMTQPTPFQQIQPIGIGGIEQQARQDFAQKTLPGIAERFTAAGGQRSSAFQQQLGQAGADLETQLAALRQEEARRQQGLGLQYGLAGQQLGQQRLGTLADYLSGQQRLGLEGGRLGIERGRLGLQQQQLGLQGQELGQRTGLQAHELAQRAAMQQQESAQAARESQFGRIGNLMQASLGQQISPIYIPRQPGYLESGLRGLTGGLTSGLASRLGGI